MSVYKKKNGKYYCRFQIDGERHHYLCVGATTEKEAKKLESQFMFKVQQQQNGVISRDFKKISMNFLFDLFERHSLLNNRSYRTDIYNLKILRNYFKNKYANDITLQDLEDFKTYLLTDRKIANSTINRYRATLSKMFNLGIANKILKENPIKDFKPLRERNIKIRFLTLEEEFRLYKVLVESKSHLEPIITCALQTGMRRGEILGLKWNNIDFDYGFIELLETKSGKSRKIPISTRLLTTLNKLEKISEYVFVNPKTREPYTDIKKSFKTLLKKAKIENFRFHDLRHTVATRLATSNIDLIVVKEILGHSKIETTMRYAHAVPKRKLEAIEVLNSYN